jgi:hypothetical protein
LNPILHEVSKSVFSENLNPQPLYSRTLGERQNECQDKIMNWVGSGETLITLTSLKSQFTFLLTNCEELLKISIKLFVKGKVVPVLN